MKIRLRDRRTLYYYLKEFYKRYPNERWTIFHYVKYFKDRLRMNKDAWNAITGDTGVGKSLFALMSMILFGRPMSLIDNVSYIPKGTEIVEKLNKLKFQTFLIDEAAKEMRSVNWQSKAQQEVNMFAMTERWKNLWVFLNMPNFNEFTKSMRSGNIYFRCHVLYRTDKYARVILQRKQRNWRSGDPWNDKKASDIIDKMTKRYGYLSNEQLLTVERNLSNTLMDFIIPNLTIILPHVVEEYERLKLESRGEEFKESKDKLVNKDKYKSKYQELLKRVSRVLINNELMIGERKVTRESIAKSLGISNNMLNTYYRKPEDKPPPQT